MSSINDIAKKLAQIKQTTTAPIFTTPEQLTILGALAGLIATGKVQGADQQNIIAISARLKTGTAPDAEIFGVVKPIEAQLQAFIQNCGAAITKVRTREFK